MNSEEIDESKEREALKAERYKRAARLDYWIDKLAREKEEQCKNQK